MNALFKVTPKHLGLNTLTRPLQNLHFISLFFEPFRAGLAGMFPLTEANKVCSSLDVVLCSFVASRMSHQYGLW